MIQRTLYPRILEKLQPNKAVLLFGARRVGKTFLLKQIAEQFNGRYLFLNGEDYDTITLLSERSVANYKRLLQGCGLLIIDEAQNIPDIGAKLKLMVDEIDGIRILASGSSSFDLRNKAGEPLVGRASFFRLSPFAQQELSATESRIETKQNLETRLVYGSYPEVVLLETDLDRSDYLRDIVDSYLLKDILAIDGLKNTSKMRDLLRLVAFQVGSEVSYDELGRLLGMSKNTVEVYLDLLAKTFVLFRLGGFARNLRKEVHKAGKWYFCDNGIRNAVIGRFYPIALRDDIGAIWENYLISERQKLWTNNARGIDTYFWRTYDKQEIDYIEDVDGRISAFEFKWRKQGASVPAAFHKGYPNSAFKLVNNSNYLPFVEAIE